MEICKKQMKNHSVLAQIYKVYIIFILECDVFGKSFFPLLTIMDVTS